MPAPPEFRDALLAEFTKSLPGMIDRAWASVQRAAKAAGTLRRPEPRASKIEKGRARIAIMKVIEIAGDDGASRTDIRRTAPALLGGRPLSENTLKSVLMFLRAKGDIETKNSKWYSTRAPVRVQPMMRSMIFDKKDDD
jgi:hypothetical protein